MEVEVKSVFVSNCKPFNYYIDLVKMHFEDDADVEICAIGTAIPKAIIIAEVLQERGLATKTQVLTSKVYYGHSLLGYIIDKAEIQIGLRRTAPAP